MVSGVEFLFNYANYLYLTGNKSEAETTVDDIMMRYPNRHDVLYMAAKFYIYIKETKKAIEVLERDISIHHMQQSRQLLNQLKKNN